MLRHHTNYGSYYAVDGDCFIDDVGIAAETSLPQTVSDDRDRVLARLIFFRVKIAAHDRFHAGGVEKVCTDEKTLDTFRSVAAGEVCTPPAIDGELFERLVLRLPIEVVGHRDFVVQDAAARQFVPDRNNAIEFGEWKRFQQKRIDSTEDRGVGADAERERNDGN